MRTMKVMSAAIALAVLTGTSAFAASSDMAAGFQLGANISNFSGSSAGGTSSKTGFIIGGQFEMKLAEMFYFMPGLRYTMKGGTTSATIIGLTVENKTTVSYIELPLYMKLKLMEGETFRPFFLLGPNVGFKAGSSSDTTINGVSVASSASAVAFKSIDFAVDFGAGAEFDVDAGMALFLNIVYSLGLTNVWDATGADLKNNGIQFVAGMNFAL